MNIFKYSKRTQIDYEILKSVKHTQNVANGTCP